MTYRHEGNGHQGVRAVSIESMPHNDHGDDIDVNTEGCGDCRNDAQSAVRLVFGWLAVVVVVGHDCYTILTLFSFNSQGS